MDKNQQLLKLSENLGARQVFDDYKDSLERLKDSHIRVGIMGLPNTGKTSLINAMLDTQLHVSNLPSDINYYISYSEKSDKQASDSEKRVNIHLSCEWLKKFNISIVELNHNVVPDETSVYDLCEILSQCDTCVYLLNAQSALSRTDLFILNNLHNLDMPVIIAMSRLDLLSDSDQTDVFEYVKSNLNDYKNETLLKLAGSLKSSVSAIKSAIEATISNTDVTKVRQNFENFFSVVALGKLYEICQKHINECKAKQDDIEKSSVEKLLKLDQNSTQWLSVETQLRQKLSEVSDKLRSFLGDRKEDIERRLAHDIDICSDVKLFWEKDFPFRLEELVRAEIGSATHLVNQELTRVIQWLQDILLRQFRCKISFTTGIVNEKGKSPYSNSEEVKVADTNKLKIVTRVGTAATVITAGALLASSGIGGIIMAVSMLSGLGAEFFMRKQNNDSKQEIKKHLPDIIERTNLQIVTDFDTKMQEVTFQLISHLQTLKSDWMESSKKNIEQEKAIANFNIGSAKWDTIMERINQLSELIIQ